MVAETAARVPGRRSEGGHGHAWAWPMVLLTLQMATSFALVPGSRYGSLQDRPVLLVGVWQSISWLPSRTQTWTSVRDHAREQNEPVGHSLDPGAVHGATHSP